MNSLLFALAMGIICAYMILASQFNSFLHPITVLTILPLSVAGAAAALWMAGQSLNIFSMIGLLLLMGIVKKNSIILVDYANQMRETKGLDAEKAMLEAGPSVGALLVVSRGFGFWTEAQLHGMTYRKDDQMAVALAPSVFLGAWLGL